MTHEFVIVNANRTAIGRLGGSLKDVKAEDLAATVVKDAIQKAGLNGEQINEVILGEVRQTSEASNVARVAALKAGVSNEATGFTINRLCASGMQAVISAVQHLSFQPDEIVVAGGVENMSRAPIYLRNSRYGEGNPYLVDSNLENGQQPVELFGKDLGMGITAENVAEHYGISREDQDAFAFESQKRAKAAWENGKFDSQIVPVEIKTKKETKLFVKDEHLRDTTLEKLSGLNSVFKKEGTVTAGNACGRNDGASALILMIKEKADSLGIEPLVKISNWALAGVDPRYMGIGPVPAIQKLLTKVGKTIDEIGLIELNEAFASQSLAVIRQANIDLEKVNVNGGAIAMGHPLGATGALILTKLAHEMKARQEKFGIATLCVGGGQGMAVLLESVD